MHVRPYDDADAPNWLRCRLLSFFTTQYYDDVVTRRPRYDEPSIQLVAADCAEIVGILDVSIGAGAATIETVAVLPEHSRAGIATRLLHAALPELEQRELPTLDAWTREDPAANAWYRRNGFREEHRYLHVYQDWDERDAESTAHGDLGTPVRVFAHAPIEREAQLRARFRRVHVCRQYVLSLAR
ncbi:GNAT family N-acetyltransferase [Jiangella muralis]|uniref:GNAT family N-acetyltransferase n=1 Tax=Jiangella muralis TaxID=702383 RepID=UPI001969C0BD|nr:GNAT family N-acetyltransferase [Jiangella muralis]